MSDEIPAVDGVCEECGFDYDGVADIEIGDKLRDFGRRYRVPLTRGLKGEALDDLVRAHPQEGVWSALEYTCHVRDVFAGQRRRVEQALVEGELVYASMGREQRAIDDRYNEQDPVTVADELAANAEAMAVTVEALTSEQWSLGGLYGYPEPTPRDLRWLARHTIHEGHHHLLDVGRVLRSARGR